MKSAAPLCLSALAALACHAPSFAQQSPAAETIKPDAAKGKAETRPAAKELIQVEVNGASEYDPRRDDTASKTVIRQEEIMKYGDTNVFDVLKRAPGVTVIGESIRMRGLGGGYTQVLVNGERPPPGFTLQSVTPEQIEKIEVVNAATAEFSTQAIAGTINIILKKVVSKPQRDVRLNLSHARENQNVSTIGTWADRQDNLSYFIHAMFLRAENDNTGTLTEEFAASDGVVRQLRDSRTRSDSRSTALGLAPRLNWKLANNGQLNWSANVSANRFDGNNSRLYSDRIGIFPEPNFIDRDNTNQSRTVFASSTLNWVTLLAGGKLDASITLTDSHSDADSSGLSSTANRQRTLQRDRDSEQHNSSVRSNGKYTRSVLGSHALATGWDLTRQRARQDEHRVEGFTGAVPQLLDESFAREVTQFAAFVQDEWNVTKQWSMYLGGRWETIRTDSAIRGAADTRSRNHVLSPIAQTLYKFPDKSGRQLRLALTRTFKAPTLDQLTARRFEADLNSRFTPDNSGNPALKPELATGVDLTYEHFWAPAAVFSVSASSRRITDYIRTTLTQDRQGLWLYQPVNDGKADVRSLAVELKFPTRLVWPTLPALDLRANVNRNWSQVASVPGPDNRLDEQIPLTASLGIDYKRDPYTIGANLAFRSGGPLRISEQQSTRLQAYRDLDTYLLYKISPSLQWRFTASNLLSRDRQNYSQYADDNGISRNFGSNASSRRLAVNLEVKL